MTEKQKNFLNEKCNYIFFTKFKKNFSVEETILYHQINVNSLWNLKKLLQNLNNLNNIENIGFNSSLCFNLKVIKLFPNLKKISCYGQELTPKLALKINQELPNIKKVYFSKISKKVLNIYDKLHFDIETFDTSLDVETDNIYFQRPFSEDNLNKLDLLKRKNLTLNNKIDYLALAELIPFTKVINNLFIGNDNFNEIKKLFKLFKHYGIIIKNTTIFCQNTNYDLTILDNINKHTKVNIMYDEDSICTLEEFKMIRQTINYYTKLIKNNDLSNFEKVMFAYDIVKTFTYKISENEKHEIYDARQIHRIIKNGMIVCVGYAKILTQILNELKIKAELILVYSGIEDNGNEEFDLINPLVNNHARVLVKLDDNKYGLHGIFSLDPTWDSNKKDETGLDKYYYFLNSVNDYTKIYPCDSYPKLYSYFWHFETKQSLKLKNNCNCTNELTKCLYNFFGSISPDEKTLNAYMNAPSFDEQDFAKALKKVRIAQGYPENSIQTEINHVLFNNQK